MTRHGQQAIAAPYTRRQFIASSLTTVAGLTLVAPVATRTGMAHPLPQADDRITRLSEHLLIYHGPVQVGVIRDRDRAWLIDCGDEQVAQVLQGAGVGVIERVLVTHYHRDQHCGAGHLPGTPAISVPREERALVEQPLDYWRDDQNLYRVYRSFRPDHLTPTRPTVVQSELVPGQILQFGPARIAVLNTPGHTDGSLSFLVDVDGQRVLFCGDLMAGEGQLWDLYSLQKGFEQGGAQVGGYHGFLGDRWQLAESLKSVRHCEPGMIVPSHGPPIAHPGPAIESLEARLDSCYENYVSISALRHYFPKLFTAYDGRPGQMPLRAGTEPPPCLRHFGTTWMLVSRTGAAWVMDVGSQAIVQRIEKMLAEGEIRSVDGLWVTHYHFDHTDGIPLFQQQFDCPCVTDQRLADVLVQPAAWRLPCLAAEPIRVDRKMADGQSWQWQEFKLTSYYYPGQTLYHAAMLVEQGDLRMLFVGDSHTPGGLDDYCAHNRNLLGRGVGFQYCLDLLEKLQPTHLFNCHVDDAFTFTADEIATMRKQLDARERMINELAPWPHANFATDPCWVRIAPYRQVLKPAQIARCEAVITNHAPAALDFACRAQWPSEAGQGTAWSSGQAPAKTELRLPLTFTVPANTPVGRVVVPIDVQIGQWRLNQFTECIIDVTE